MKRLLLFLGALLVATYASAQTQTTSTASPKTHELDLAGSTQWTDTGIDLALGQPVTITATGTLQYMDGNAPGPQGVARGWKDLLRSMPMNSAGRGALIGRIGSDDAAQPFLVAAQLKFTVRVPGRLFLGINGPSGDSAQGSFHVKIEISGAASEPSASTASATGAANAAPVTASNAPGGSALKNVSASETAAGSSTPPATPASGNASSSSSASDPAAAALLPSNFFAQIPRRVTDKDGNVGDMVNFLLIGSEDQVKAAFQAAGWGPSG